MTFRAFPTSICTIGLFALILSVSGCQESGPVLGTVVGRVTLDGRPLEGAAIVFSPKAQAVDAGSSRGKTGADGRYALSFGSSRKGAYLGEHSVIIEHKNYFKTDHVAKVVEGSNSIDFDLKSLNRSKSRDSTDNAELLPVGK
jgi:hypothetical protein